MFQHQYFSHELGSPQGSLISPVLCNILLNKLDIFVSNLKYNFDTGSRHKTNPEWRKLTRAGLKKEVHERNISSRLHADPNYKRLKYVRYADEFLIGIIGNKEDCLIVRDKIFSFLLSVLKLNLNLDKAKITHARSEKAHFLASDIRITPLDKRPVRLVQRGNTSFLSKSATRPQLLAPISKLVETLEGKGLARHGGKPTRWTKMLPFENHQIVKHYKLI